jgi:hypothetical protein
MAARPPKGETRYRDAPGVDDPPGSLEASP